mgnify:CR=1 FL=1
MKNITIVGGGACGSAVFIELVIQILAEELQEKVSLTLIEKDKKINVKLYIARLIVNIIRNFLFCLLYLFYDYFHRLDYVSTPL